MKSVPILLAGEGMLWELKKMLQDQSRLSATTDWWHEYPLSVTLYTQLESKVKESDDI